MTLRVEEGRLDARVLERLDTVELGDDEVVILPTAVRSNGVWYTLDDVATLKLVRDTGVSARFVDAEAEYLHEYSAGWMADVSLAILGDIQATVVSGVVTAIWLRAKQAVKSGTRHGAVRDVPLRLSVTRRHDSPEGTRTETVELDGATRDVIRALPEVMKKLDPELAKVDILGHLEDLEQADDV